MGDPIPGVVALKVMDVPDSVYNDCTLVEVTNSSPPNPYPTFAFDPITTITIQSHHFNSPTYFENEFVPHMYCVHV